MCERKLSSISVVLGATLALLLMPLAAGANGDSDSHRGRWWGKQRNICKKTADLLESACHLETWEDATTEQAVCRNLTDGGERRECKMDLHRDAREASRTCGEVHDERTAVCKPLGPDAYDPQYEPEDFVKGIDNPYAPYQVGSRWVYEKDDEDGLERIVVEVLDETIEIEGVECTVVRDRVWLDGVLIEDTFDWLAQHVNGDVWYFGELSKNFEDGLLTDLDGSFKAGEDGAKPGIWMKLAPYEGEYYRQEWYVDEAEDVVEVIDLDSDEVVPFGAGRTIRQTRDFTPLEPGVEEFKYYAKGIGLALEVDPESGERLELIEYTP